MSTFIENPRNGIKLSTELTIRRVSHSTRSFNYLRGMDMMRMTAEVNLEQHMRVKISSYIGWQAGTGRKDVEND